MKTTEQTGCYFLTNDKDSLFIFNPPLIKSKILKFCYFIAFLSIIIFCSCYIFLKIEVPSDMKLHERIIVTTFAIISTGSVIFCFSGLFAWIFFSEQSLSVEHSVLSYKLTVLIPVKKIEVHLSNIVESEVSRRGGYFTILIRTFTGKFHIFYTASYSRNKDCSKKTESLRNISNRINSFIDTHKK